MSTNELDLRELGPVAVTGAGGYIASWIVRDLLAAGVTVHGTVRDRSRADKVAHLERLVDELPAGARGRLELFDADLLSPGTFDAAFAGCVAVVHTASPFFISGIGDPQRQLVDPALKGTRNVLESCTRVGTVRQVVLTSSAAAVYGDNADRAGAPGGVFDETIWNESSSLQVNPYSYSKTVAEREAWKMHDAQPEGPEGRDASAGDGRWSLAVINPTFVLGPALSDRSDSTSVTVMRQMTDGTFRFGAPDLSMGVVDVRDVARAHVLALARKATGRHLLAARSMTFVEIGHTLRKEVGDRYPFPRGKIPRPLLFLLGPLQGLDWRYLRANIGIPIEFDTTRSRELLGLAYRPVETSLKDAIEHLEASGLAGRRR